MFARTTMGFVFCLTLILTPWPIAHAQEQSSVDLVPVDTPADSSFENEETYTESVTEQQDISGETVKVQSEILEDQSAAQPIDGDNPLYLESAGMTLEDFMAKNPTEEEINTLSEDDKLLWKQAEQHGILKTSITAGSPEELGFTPEQAVVKDCDPERFVTCSEFIYQSVYTPRNQPPKYRVIHVKVKNLLEQSGTYITAIITAKFLRNDPGVPEETITARLTDQNKDPLTATFTIYSAKLDLINESSVSNEGITIPPPSKNDTRHIVQSIRYSSVTSSAIVVPLDQYTEGTGKIRCGKAWATSKTLNCVNPEASPTITFDANDGFPHIAQNIHAAIAEGKPSVLTRDNTQVRAHRFAACSGSGRARLGKKPGNDVMKDATCDEYPFASTKEGGSDTRVAWVPRSENSKQGGVMVQFLMRNQVQKGDQFIVEAVVG